MLVQPDGDADVVVAQPDSVGTRLGGAGRGGAGVEHVREGDARQADHADDGVGIGHRPAAADTELDVVPAHPRVGDGGSDGIHTHLHRRLALETAEWVQPHPDDGDVVHPGSFRVSPTVNITVKPASGERHGAPAAPAEWRPPGQPRRTAFPSRCRLRLGRNDFGHVRQSTARRAAGGCAPPDRC